MRMLHGISSGIRKGKEIRPGETHTSFTLSASPDAPIPPMTSLVRDSSPHPQDIAGIEEVTWNPTYNLHIQRRNKMCTHGSRAPFISSSEGDCFATRIVLCSGEAMGLSCSTKTFPCDVKEGKQVNSQEKIGILCGTLARRMSSDTPLS